MRMKITWSDFNWQPNRNIGETLSGALKRVLALRDGGLTRHWCITALHYGRFVAHLVKYQGWRGTVIYLKACHVLLQQVAGGQRLEDTRQLGCAVARTRSGLPLVIPAYHRKAIRSGELWTLRLWSSFFWLYRVIDFPGKIKLQSIMRPFEVEYSLLVEYSCWLVRFLPILLKRVGMDKASKEVASKARILSPEMEIDLFKAWGVSPSHFIEHITSLLLPKHGLEMYYHIRDRHVLKTFMNPILSNLQPRPLLLLKSGPNSAKGPSESPGPATRTSIGSILTDMLMWKTVGVQLLQHATRLWGEAMMFTLTFMGQAQDVVDELESHGAFIEQAAMFWEMDSQGQDPIKGFSWGRSLGKLGFLPEPAGKIRVFAMVDSLTQMLLKPLHDAIFSILKEIPQDGTHDQMAPAFLLIKETSNRGLSEFFSYDLSAATDRFPISLQQVVLGFLLDPSIARHWRSLLVDREYSVPRNIGAKQRVPRGTPKTVRYGAGQPMGAYTSWAVFSLTHHLLVQFAAYQAGKGFNWYNLYALLGDDVVIAERAVAEKYLLLLQAIGVEVGLAKSLISQNGAFEFAKKTFRQGIDISGISLAAVGASITDPSVLEALLLHCNVRGPHEALRVSMRVLGYGYRARASMNWCLNSISRLQGIALLLTRPSSPFGLPFSDWILQRELGIAPPLREERMVVLMDALRQSLISTAERLADARIEFLRIIRNPLDEGELPERVLTNPLVRTSGPQGVSIRINEPPAFEQALRAPIWSILETSPKLSEFLVNWVLRPYVENIQSDLDELLEDLRVWREDTTNEGNFSLDEIYTSLERLVGELERVDTTLNILVRASPDTKSSTRIRSSAVRLWRRCRRIVAGSWDD